MRIGSDCKEEAWPSEVMYKAMETGGDGNRFYVCRNEPETTISDVIEIRSVGRSEAVFSIGGRGPKAVASIAIGITY